MWKKKINRVSRNPTKSEKPLAKHACDRELIFRIYTEFQKIITKQSSQYIGKDKQTLAEGQTATKTVKS